MSWKDFRQCAEIQALSGARCPIAAIKNSPWCRKHAEEHAKSDEK